MNSKTTTNLSQNISCITEESIQKYNHKTIKSTKTACNRKAYSWDYHTYIKVTTRKLL